MKNARELAAKLSGDTFSSPLEFMDALTAAIEARDAEHANTIAIERAVTEGMQDERDAALAALKVAREALENAERELSAHIGGDLPARLVNANVHDIVATALARISELVPS